MKRIFLHMVLLLLAVQTHAQVYQLVWSKGEVLYAISTEDFDSVSYDFATDIDLSHVRLYNAPTTTVSVLKTDTVYVHDTLIITQIRETRSSYRPHAFSIGGNRQIEFSKGNLQYNPAEDKWRFADLQTDFIGGTNYRISSSYNGWLDLFGWSASDSDNYGLSTSTSTYGSAYSGSFVDWGTNQIGADAPNTWRTLFEYEWNYILYYRPNASSLFGIAQVNGINGLILLPDDWVCPADITFKSGTAYSNGTQYYPAYQSFTASQWAEMEAVGAIFLPATGYRYGSDVRGVQTSGYYWTATGYDDDESYRVNFYSNGKSVNDDYKSSGYAVRLVKDL